MTIISIHLLSAVQVSTVLTNKAIRDPVHTALVFPLFYHFPCKLNRMQNVLGLMRSILIGENNLAYKFSCSWFSYS